MDRKKQYGTLSEVVLIEIIGWTQNLDPEERLKRIGWKTIRNDEKYQKSNEKNIQYRKEQNLEPT